MTSLAEADRSDRIADVRFDERRMHVLLQDGREISVPLWWYPRLLHGTSQERCNWRLIGHGEGVHWPDLDEDVSAENLVLGKPSGESQGSLKRWLEQRASRKA